MSESKKDSKYFSMDDELFDLKHGDAKDKSVAALKMGRVKLEVRHKPPN